MEVPHSGMVDFMVNPTSEWVISKIPPFQETSVSGNYINPSCIL